LGWLGSAEGVCTEENSQVRSANTQDP